jgi:hypothetical protein
MKAISILVAVLLTGAAAYAQNPTCKAQATAKNLHGAALTSFMTKCQRDATAVCETDSKNRKLVGAAKSSHMKKCVQDAVG